MAPIQSWYQGLLVTLRILKNMITAGPIHALSWSDHSKRPKLLDDPELGEHIFVQLKDVKLHCVVKGNPNNPLMLFVHGFPEFWFSWRHQIKEFADTYRVVAVDMRGFSESDRPVDVSNYTLPTLAADIEQLVHKLGYKSCILVGHDWGAAVSYVTAAEYPHLVDRLIIMNGTHPSAMTKLLATSPKQRQMSWYMTFYQLPYLPEFYMRTKDYGIFEKGLEQGLSLKTFMSEEELEAYKYTYRDYESLRCPINYYRAMWLPGVKHAKIIHAPTLIIWATQDHSLDKELAVLSSKYVKNSYDIKYIEGKGHQVHQVYPEQVNKYMREYLKEEVPPASHTGQSKL